jgi:hypothetical protein
MADRYWVGGTDAWDGTAGTKWALTSGGAGGQAVPTALDDVFLDAASGAVTVTIQTVNGNAKSLNCTGFTGTLAGNGGVIIANGNLTLGAGMGFTSTGVWQFNGTGTITSNGVVFTAVMSLNGTGVTVTLGDAFTSTSNFGVARGTFTTSASNYSFTAARLTSTGTITRQIDLNGSTVTLSGTGGWEAGAATGLTFNAGTSSIVLTGQGANVTSNGHTFNNVSLTSTSSGESVFSGAGTFATLSIAAPSSPGVIRANFSGNQTITTFVANGATAVRRIMLLSSVIGTARTLTVTNYSAKDDVDFRDITAAGASSPWSGTRLGNCLGNTNITFLSAKTVYWNLSGAQSWTSTGWATTSGGSPSVDNFPLAQDTAVLDDVGAATSIAVNTLINIGTFNAAARTAAVTTTGMSSIDVYGDFINGSGVSQSITSTAIVFFSGRSTQTLTTAGQSFGRIWSNSASCTLTFADAVNSSSGSQAIQFTVGASLDTGSYNVTAGTASFSGSSNLNLGTTTWTLFGASAIWSVTSGVTVTGSANFVLTNTTTTDRIFEGAGRTYGKLTIGGATGVSTLTINGANTFSEIASTKTVAHTIVFANVTTTTGAWTVSGSSGNLVTLARTGASGTFTLAKTGGGVVSSNFLSISNSTATPGSTWYAGANSTNGGGNTGWIFANAPSLSGGNFFQFFV